MQATKQKSRLCFIVLALTLLLGTLLGVPASAQEEALLLNGSFDTMDESGLITGWSYSEWDEGAGSTYRLEQQLDGNMVLRIDSVNDNDVRVEQTVKVSGNTLYRISGRVKAEGFASDLIGANLSVKDTFASSASITNTAGEWVDVEMYGRTTLFQSSIIVCARTGFYGELNAGTAWFDDIAVEPVSAAPEGVEIFSLRKVEAAENTQENGHADWIPLFTFLCAVAALFLYLFIPRNVHLLDGSPTRLNKVLWIGLGAAFILRVILALATNGYEVDMGCFKGWALNMADVGPMNFYDSVFCDYPPGYLYILWLIGLIANVFALPYDTELFTLLIKLPAILADIGIALMIFKLCKRWCRPGLAALAALAYAVLPAVWLNSAMWGQMDAILVLLLLVVLDFMLDKKMLHASLFYGLAVLVKPQALMFGTILLCGFISDILEDRKKGFASLGISFTACVALMLLLITPFSIGRGFGWIVDKYLSVLTSYPYASVNAMNLFGVLGGNWVEQTELLLGLPYATWGTIGMGLSVFYGLFIYFKAHDRKAILLTWACILLGVFVLGVRMHERYMFPLLAIVLLAAIAYDDKRLLLVFAGLALTNGINIFVVLQNDHILVSDRALQIVTGCINILLLGEMWNAAFRLAIRMNPHSIQEMHRKPLKPQVLSWKLPTAQTPGEKPRLTRWDAPIMLGITLVYAATAFWQLGDTTAPATLWQGKEEQPGVVFDLGEEKQLGRFYYYGEINYGTLEICFSQDGLVYGESYILEVGVHDMFKWHVVKTNTSARYAMVTVTSGDMKIYEIGFADENGTPYPVTTPEQKNFALIDEQTLIPQIPGYMNSMYFDEVYHGRTAYEQLHGITWYENTHPPLGKVFISWAISLLGMTPFAWRFAGTLAGVLMVPAIYYLAKLLFKKTSFAAVACLLFTFDFMHLAQTRLGTIDSYPVLFIILGFACMLRYAYMSFYHDKLWKTLVPLFFSGIFMGLGIASKWIGVYAGMGLAIFFFAIFYTRTKEYLAAKKLDPADESVSKEDKALAAGILKKYPKCALITLLACVVFFVVIPLGIYIGSYYQYLQIDGNTLEDVWQYQVHMFNYHKGVFDTHSFESPWWQWPLMLKPIWYFLGEFEPAGTISSIASFGNPAVWWPGLAAILWVLARAVQGYGKQDKRIYIVLLGYLANYLPWVLVPRTTFIYHYFASTPFMVMAIVLFLEDFYARAKKPARGKAAIIAYVAVAIGLYVLFYPVLTGVPMPDVQAMLLKWLPSWTLF